MLGTKIDFSDNIDSQDGIGALPGLGGTYSFDNGLGGFISVLFLTCISFYLSVPIDRVYQYVSHVYRAKPRQAIIVAKDTDFFDK